MPTLSMSAFRGKADIPIELCNVGARSPSTREEAVTAIECIVSTFAEAGYEPAHSGGQLLDDGDRTRFVIEGV
jgi:hypothetical protein